MSAVVKSTHRLSASSSGVYEVGGGFAARVYAVVDSGSVLRACMLPELSMVDVTDSNGPRENEDLPLFNMVS
jgi:hypothetical protein